MNVQGSEFFAFCTYLILGSVIAGGSLGILFKTFLELSEIRLKRSTYNLCKIIVVLIFILTVTLAGVSNLVLPEEFEPRITLLILYVLAILFCVYPGIKIAFEILESRPKKY